MNMPLPTPSLATSADLEILLEAMRASELILNEKNDSAKQICDRLISSANWDKAKNSIKVFVFNVRGMACQRLKLFDCAIADYQKAREIEPGNLMAIAYLGDIFRETGRLNEAKNYLDLLIAGDPEKTSLNYYSVLLMRCQLLMRSKQFDKALADCEKALELNTDNAFAFTLKAQILRALGRLDDSIKAYQSALACAPSGSAKARAHVNLSTGYLKIGDTTSALLQCDLALAEDQNTAIAYNNRAWILAHLGKVDAALTPIEIAMSIQPVSANTQATRGFIFYLLGRTEEAKKDFDESLAKDPAIAEALYFRAAILEKSGLTEQAAQDYARAKELEFELPSFSTLTIRVEST